MSESPRETVKTVLELDLASYSDVARILEENLDVSAVKALEDQVQSFVDHGLNQVGLKRTDVVLGSAGDNAILVFDNPTTMHHFAEVIQERVVSHNAQRTVKSAHRWFRMGAATGPVMLLLEERRIVGTTVARAVRLEGAAMIGEIVVDAATYNSLPSKLKDRYDAEEEVRGKRDEVFLARRCTLVQVAPPRDNHGRARVSKGRIIATAISVVSAVLIVCAILIAVINVGSDQHTPSPLSSEYLANWIGNASSNVERQKREEAIAQLKDVLHEDHIGKLAESLSRAETLEFNDVRIVSLGMLVPEAAPKLKELVLRRVGVDVDQLSELKCMKGLTIVLDNCPGYAGHVNQNGIATTTPRGRTYGATGTGTAIRAAFGTPVDIAGAPTSGPNDFSLIHRQRELVQIGPIPGDTRNVRTDLDYAAFMRSVEQEQGRMERWVMQDSSRSYWFTVVVNKSQCE